MNSLFCCSSAARIATLQGRYVRALCREWQNGLWKDLWPWDSHVWMVYGAEHYAWSVLCAVMYRSTVYSVRDGFGGYIGCRCEWELDLHGGQTTFAPCWMPRASKVGGDVASDFSVGTVSVSGYMWRIGTLDIGYRLSSFHFLCLDVRYVLPMDSTLIRGTTPFMEWIKYPLMFRTVPWLMWSSVHESFIDRYRWYLFRIVNRYTRFLFMAAEEYPRSS